MPRPPLAFSSRAQVTARGFSFLEVLLVLGIVGLFILCIIGFFLSRHVEPLKPLAPLPKPAVSTPAPPAANTPSPAAATPAPAP